jgi:hypothetical protein
MAEKLNFKKMDKKQLRKIAKEALKEVSRLGKQVSFLEKDKAAVKNREISWKSQFDAEVYYKKQALIKVEKLEKRIAELEKSRLPEGKLKVGQNDYIGMMPGSLTMGVDGQLNERDCVEHKWVLGKGVVTKSEEVVDEDNRIVTPISQENINKKMDEAVAWAKRNGHHQPEGNPDPDRSTSVRIKSADEISAENVEKHTEIVCNDIANDKSRLLNIDLGDEHESIPPTYGK